jgi:hypothetical protein
MQVCSRTSVEAHGNRHDEGTKDKFPDSFPPGYNNTSSEDTASAVSITVLDLPRQPDGDNRRRNLP